MQPLDVHYPDPERVARINREWDEMKRKLFPADDLEVLRWVKPGVTVVESELQLVDDQHMENGRWTEHRRMVFVDVNEPLKHWELLYEQDLTEGGYDTFGEAMGGHLTCHLVKGIPVPTIVWEWERY